MSARPSSLTSRLAPDDPQTRLHHQRGGSAIVRASDPLRRARFRTSFVVRLEDWTRHDVWSINGDAEHLEKGAVAQELLDLGVVD